MRVIWLLALLALVFTAGICTAEVPNLVGNWSGSGIGYYEGAIEKEENDSVSLNITEQDDRIFIGNVTLKQKNGTYKVEGLAGVVAMDDKTFYVAEFDQGFDFGRIVSEDEIELIYLQDGKSAQAFIERYHRVKS